MTQKKILLKSTRTLGFQCPLRFRCQTRDYDSPKGNCQVRIRPHSMLLPTPNQYKHAAGQHHPHHEIQRDQLARRFLQYIIVLQSARRPLLLADQLIRRMHRSADPAAHSTETARTGSRDDLHCQAQRSAIKPVRIQRDPCMRRHMRKVHHKGKRRRREKLQVLGSLTPPSSKNLSKRCKRLIFLSIS